MLDELFGNRNLEKVLLFLLVNKKCYGKQLERVFNLPLTPLQNALKKLEKGKVTKSFYQGKTKVYEFNLNYPLYEELESLLRKRYLLLPSQEKTEYHNTCEDRFNRPSEWMKTSSIIKNFWQRLKEIKSFSLEGKNQEKGMGLVMVNHENNQLIFTEKGKWLKGEIEFTNTYRWTFDTNKNMINLEHLRYGKDHPVFLFHLTLISHWPQKK